MGEHKWALILFCTLANIVFNAKGQDLPTVYEYYTDGGITSGVQELPGAFLLNERNITILSGAIHYFRVHPDYWRDRLQKLRAAGANTVETYVPWNLHNPSPGKYDFGGGEDDLSPFLDIVKFVQIAKEEDLLVIVRPGPYICAEFEFGGMPSWLLRDSDIKVRTSDPKFEGLVRDYFSQLFPLLVDLQFTNGGPIIAFQVENEYGNTKFSLQPLDQQYLINLHEMMMELGLKEMFFTSDTPGNPGGNEGFVPSVLRTANFKTRPEYQLDLLQRQQPGKPSMVMEFWTGWFDHWLEETHSVTNVDVYSDVLERILAYPASVNMYMFHGGTSWGFLNGANVYPYFPFYEADTSTYDYDAPLSEGGDYTDKYWATQRLYNEYNPVKTFITTPPEIAVKVAYPSAPVIGQISFDDIISQIPQNEKFQHEDVINMEALDLNDGAGQSYGYILYRKTGVPLGVNSTLKITGVTHGIATVIVDGVIKTKPLTAAGDIRGFGYWIQRDAELQVTSDADGSRTLDILVENFGRNNYGRLADFDQRKGLYDGPVVVDNLELKDWEVIALQFKGAWVRSLSGWSSELTPVTAPTLFRATLSVDEPRDTFIDMTGWGKGVVFVNGFNLGRYFDIGPARTLYVPAPLLNVGLNEIVVFEQFSPASEIVFSEIPILGNTEETTPEPTTVSVE